MSKKVDRRTEILLRLIMGLSIAICGGSAIYFAGKHWMVFAFALQAIAILNCFSLGRSRGNQEVFDELGEKVENAILQVEMREIREEFER